MTGWQTNDESERFRRMLSWPNEVLSQNFLEGLRKTMKTLRMAGIPAKIITKHILNISLDHCW
jgi:hypothetical protein